MMENLLQDIKFGFRQLVKHPGFTLIAVVALGLGIGSVSTQISVVNGLFFKGLPFPGADRLAHLERVNVEQDNYSAEVPAPEFLEWQKQQEFFVGLAGYYSGTANLTVGDIVSRYNGCFLTPNSFELLQVNAAIGRTLNASDNDPGAPHVVVLSHKIWASDFGRDPEIVGKSAILNGRPVTIVGVMPEGFGFPVTEELWAPLFNQQKIEDMQFGRQVISLEVFGRLKDDASFDMARSNMAVIARTLENDHPEFQKGFRDVKVQPFIEEFIGGETKSLTAVMLLITFLILLIACANVANLLLARSLRRQKEVAIRSALGASRSRIISQFITESLLIAILGSVLALIMAVHNTRQLNNSLAELNAPFWIDFTFDWRVLLAVMAITIGTGVLSGIIPAYRASRMNQNEVLKDDTRTSSSLHLGRFSRILVVVQISMAAVILTLVVLFTKSVSNALNIEYTYGADDIMTARIGLFEDAYPTGQDRANLLGALIANLTARPEIMLAGTSHRYQFLGGPGINYEMPGRVYADKSDREFCRFQYVSIDFLRTVGLPLLRGENFQPEDFTHDTPRKVIINRAMAEREWPGDNPVGRQFKPEFILDGVEFESLPMVEVIGVVEGMQEQGGFTDMKFDGAAFYAPQTVATTPAFITILARPGGSIDTTAAVIREELRRLDANLPIYMVGTPREINKAALVQLDFFTGIFRDFGILAAFLAAVGIYGVITFSVNQRVMEFGIRQALGATRAAVFRLVFAHAARQLTTGFLIALLMLSPIILSPGVRDSISIFFYQIDPNSVTPYLWSFGFVTLISIFAATPPALRAARIHPAQALRYG